MRHIQDRVAAALAESGVAAGDRIGVACSGGPDSAVLAHVALQLHRRGLLGPVTLLHVDHGLRPDSAADGEVVAGIARRWGGAVVLLPVQVDRGRASLEAAARDARYAALDQAAADLGLCRVLLAHTASDQAETVLMRVLRGTGVTGLAAIPPVRDVYLRPLLGTTRAEIEAYQAAFDVPAVADPMNHDPAFLRNRVRHRWLPALRNENPRLDQSLCRLADAAREQAQVLDYAASLLLAQSSARGAPARADVPPPAAAALDLRVLAQAPAAVAGRALALVAARAGAGPLGARHRQALLALAGRPTAGTVTIDLPGLTAVREYDTLRLVPARHRAHPVGPVAAEPPQTARVHVSGPDGPYTVRRWQPGDRMRPARLRGRSRKLSDLFVDAKLPRPERAKALVVTRACDGVIEWAQHIGPAFRSRVSVSLTMEEPMASNKVSD